MNETDYWRDRAAGASTHPIEPPRWSSASPDEWEREGERCRAMSRAARAHLAELAPMFDAWAIAWDRRSRAYVLVVEARNRAAVAAVVNTSDAETARQQYRSARAAESDRLSLLSLPWCSALDGAR